MTAQHLQAPDVRARSRATLRSRLDAGFWAKTDRSGECWNWTGKRQVLVDGRLGYGRLRRFGRQIYAHRRAYELAIGPIPDRMLVLHSCDNPACIRPEHLHLGTHSDNLREAWARGIQPRSKTPLATCRRGHVFDETNTIRRRNGRRLCRVCTRAYELARGEGITVPAPPQQTLDGWAPGEITELFGR